MNILMEFSGLPRQAAFRTVTEKVLSSDDAQAVNDSECFIQSPLACEQIGGKEE